MASVGPRSYGARGRTGKFHISDRLSLAKARKLRRIYEHGIQDPAYYLSQAALARAFCISSKQAYRVINNQQWRERK